MEIKILLTENIVKIRFPNKVVPIWYVKSFPKRARLSPNSLVLIFIVN